MNAPDDIRPESVQIPPEALAAGQRSLAAIVFTDTVGFSALMSKDEERALRLVGRDLDHMKVVCGSFGGQVLKSTGDGLLMLFTSAVQAVACALEIQRDFQKQNLELPQADRLQHRIGIHLGDVFQHGGDVMGDGVNIAARLQTQAVPGGICLSQTVFDVVNNRLPFYVNDLGERKLKNIGMVKAYQISPSEGGSVSYRMAWHRKWRSSLWAGVGLVSLLLLFVIVFESGRYIQWAMHHPGQHGSFPLLPVMTSTPVKAPNAPTPGATAPTTSTAPPAVSQPAGLAEVSETEFEETSFRYMTKYDFDGMETWIAEHDWPSKSSDSLAQACPQLNHLVTWARQQLQQYTAEMPLQIIGKDRFIYYWGAPFGGVKQKIVMKQPKPGEEPRFFTLGADQIQPGAMAAIMHALIKAANPADAQTIQLSKELHLFVQTYHIAVPQRKPVQAPVTTASPPPPSVRRLPLACGQRTASI